MNKWKIRFKELERELEEKNRLIRSLNANISYYREMLSSTLEEEMKLKRVLEEVSNNESKIKTDVIESLYNMINNGEEL